MLALNEELLKIFQSLFIKKGVISYDEKILKFFKFIQLPIAISKHKFNNNQLLKQQGSIFKIYDKNNDEELVKSTKLKLMLTDENINSDFVTVNILNDEIDVRFSATYGSGQNKNKAKKHIKALLSDAEIIKIYDKYLSIINRNFDVWKEINLNILKYVLPRKNINIEIFCGDNWDNSRKQDLTNIYDNWYITKRSWNANLHDRYIETDKVKILLSSGLSNLDNRGKDFSYMVFLC